MFISSVRRIWRMAKDHRKKGCPNGSCERNQKKIKLSATEEFCPKCGIKLVYVCTKCFKEIEDIDPKHKVCKLCEAEASDKKQKIGDMAKKAGGAAVGVVTPVVIGVGRKVVKDGQKGAIKAGVKAVEGVAKAIVKK